MSAHLEEEEQLEAIKSWWKDNGRFTIISFVLMITVYAGWHFWQQHQYNQLGRAAALYVEMMKSQDQTLIARDADALIASHGGTIFAAVAALKKAQLAVESKDMVAAEKSLKAVIDSADNDAFKQLARLRLARIHLGNDKVDQALSILAVVNDNGLQGWVAWVKAQCYQKLGKFDLANQAYSRASTALSDNKQASELITQQWMALPGQKKSTSSQAKSNKGEQHA